MSTSTTYMPLREAGARARAMLLAAAAQRWNVDVTELRTEDGKVFNGRKSLSYGALADAASKLPVPEKVTLKDPAQFRYLGKPQKRLDSPMKVDGSAKFGIDMRAAGHVVRRHRAAAGDRREAAQARRHGRARRARAWSMSSNCPAGIAVYATNTWAAKRGREALAVEWDEGPNNNLSTDGAARRVPAARATAPGAVARPRGNVRSALRGRGEAHGRGIRAALSGAFAHGAAQLPGRRARRWLRPVPGHADAVARIAMPWPQALGMDPAKVKVHTAFLGGGFGRRAQRYSEAAVEAAQASQAVGKPVLVTRTREDDVQGMSYRPFVLSRVRAASTAMAMPWPGSSASSARRCCAAAVSRLHSQGSEVRSRRASKAPPTCPTRSRTCWWTRTRAIATVPILWWRSVGHSHTGFTVNCAMDELAALAGRIRSSSAASC